MTEITDRIQFVGVLQGRPMFEFQGQFPPPWMVSGIRTGKVEVRDEAAFIGERRLYSGDVLAEEDFA